MLSTLANKLNLTLIICGLCFFPLPLGEGEGEGLPLAHPNPHAHPLCDANARTQQQYFNTACFQTNPSNTATGLPNTPGNSSRGIINGPSTKRVDFTMIKNIRFGETTRLQIRAEAFNIFNHTNFRTIGSGNVTSGVYGVITGVRDPRTMQFGAKLYF